MAIKYYCDGCDEQVANDLIKKVTVRVEFTGTSPGSGGQYELCGHCAKQLTKDADPRKWVRCTPERVPA